MKDKRLVTLLITIFIDLLGFGIVIPIIATLGKELALKETVSISPDILNGLTLGIFSLMQFLFSPVWGSLSDRIGRRPVILGSILATAAGYAIMGFASSVWILLLARTIAGIGSANLSAAQAYISDISAPQDRAKMMGLIGAAFGVGFAVGPFIGAVLYQAGGLMLVGMITAALCLINFFMAVFILSESLHPETREANRNQPTQIKETFTGLIHIWSVKYIGHLFLINVIFVLAFSMMQGNAAVLWKEKYLLPQTAVNYLFGIIGLFSAIIQGGLIGFFQKKIGIKKMLVYGAILEIIGLVIIPLPGLQLFWTVAIISIIFLTTGNGMILPSTNAMISIYSDQNHQGKIFGLLQSIGALARGVGPILAGAIYMVDRSMPYFVAAILMAFTAFFSYKLINRLPGSDFHQEVK